MKRIILAICLILLPIISGHALTPAGTVLTNTASILREDGSVWVSCTLNQTVAQVAGVAVSLPPTAKAQAGKSWQGYLTLTNMGNGPDSFALTKQATLPWTINLTDYVGVLAQDETRRIPVSVAIPGGTAGQVDTITITAKGLFDSTINNADTSSLTSFKPGKGK